jgi:hypothetical protein
MIIMLKRVVLGLFLSARRVRNKIAKKRFKIKLTSVKEFLYNTNQPKHNNKICHIIASGSSVLTTTHIIDSSDYVIGFGFSWLLPIKYDLYLIESASRDYIGADSLNLLDNPKEINIASLKLCELRKSEFPSTILCLKNILSDLVNKSEISAGSHKYIDMCLDEMSVIGLGGMYTKNQHYWNEEILTGDYSYFLQSETTATTAISIAYKMGFKKIIIHGLDGKGVHFFKSKEYVPEEKVKEIANLLIKLISSSDDESSREAGLSLVKTMGSFKAILKEKGCNLSEALSLIRKKA